MFRGSNFPLLGLKFGVQVRPHCLYRIGTKITRFISTVIQWSRPRDCFDLPMATPFQIRKLEERMRAASPIKAGGKVQRSGLLQPFLKNWCVRSLLIQQKKSSTHTRLNICPSVRGWGIILPQLLPSEKKLTGGSVLEHLLSVYTQHRSRFQ